jgi:hypothetical protein
MKKSEQIIINQEVENAFDRFNKETGNLKRLGQLRSCSAAVFATDSFYVLRSYNTIIALIDKASDTLYDGLRLVYGYTATSGKHVAKFRQDYGSGKWGCAHELRWYSV